MKTDSHLSSRLRPRLKPIFHLNRTQTLARERLLHKLQNGSYAMEQVDCVVCGPAPYDVVAEREQYGLPYRVAMCRRCGLLWTTPRMTSAAAAKFYADEFRELHGGVDERAVEATFIKKSVLGVQLFDFCRGAIATSGLVLEVGCGTGANLKPFHDHGYAVAGCDYGERYLQYGLSQGIGGLVVGGADALIPEYSGRASLVILSHVLEHFADIPTELSTIRRLLAPGGRLLVAVPGLRRLRESSCLGNLLAYFIISHNYHFSLQSLINVLAANAFVLDKGDERILALFAAGSATTSMVKSSRDEDLEFLRGLERRWTTWTLPERFVWERRHLGLRRRVAALTPLGLRRKRS